MAKGSPRRDVAVSDVMGTLLLLGATVAVVAVAALELRESTLGAERTQPLGVDLSASWGEEEGGSNVTLLHRGGDAVPAQGLLVHVDVNDERRHSGPLLPLADGAVWRLGERVKVPIPRGVQPGDRVDVTVVSTARGEVVATASLVMPVDRGAAGARAPGFNLTAYFPEGRGVAVVNTSSPLVLEARVVHPLGRGFVEDVEANLAPLLGPSSALLRDDGTAGDALAGDGVYSRAIETGRLPTAGVRNVTVRAVDFNGSVVTTVAPLVVARTATPLPDVLTFNRTIFSGVGVRLEKDPRGLGAVSVHLRTLLTRPDAVKSGTETLYPKTAVFNYVTFRPGDKGTTSPKAFACAAMVTKPEAPEWVWPSISIPNYDPDRHLLQYFFTITFESKDGRGITRTVALQSESDTQYLTMRSTEVTKLVESEPGAFNAIGPCR